MKLFQVNINNLKFGDRLVPQFYFYTEIVKKHNLRYGISYVRLGDFARISDGEHSAIPRNHDGGIRYLYGRNIKEGIIDFDPISDDSYIYDYDYIGFPRCHIYQNDVLIAIYGTVGKSAVYKKEYVGEAGIPRHIANITIKPTAPFSPEYLAAFFRSNYGKWQINSVITGNIQQLLSLKNLREFEIPIINDNLINQITNSEKKAIECEIEAQKRIKSAQSILYQSLPVDLKAIKGDFTFSIPFSELNRSNIWSTSFYNKLYVKVANVLQENLQVKQLSELVNIGHGDEVGSDSYNTYINRTISDKPFIRTSDIVNNEVDLYPDFYISVSDTTNIKQDVQPGDIIFTKDGKIGCVGMITNEDAVVLSSGIATLRLNQFAIEHGITPEYLFVVLSIPEIGKYAAIRRTVIASTIPHLRPERLKEIEIPILEKNVIDSITTLIKQAFTLKAERKRLLKTIEHQIDNVLIKAN